ncbi:MAG TPA: CPBP family intramembrane glutamic endopeptidase, partial [Pyrinomonadaceae bacterium]|nr:CPBP family intramembrane glutamic endopeptidase [Pyrinomonadaceae bacterium]
AVLLVSALFAGVHLLQYFDNFGVVAVITILSVSLTLVRARTGRLLPSFVIHLVFNTIQAAVLIVQPFVGKSATEPKASVGFLIQTLSTLFC